ncbi:MAG TPA: amidohydrolase family protein [Chloroflexota bacterium]|nr:amidohydrolase family protein [Chloroflexota bacterium]
MRIDVHAHYYTNEFAERMDAWRGKPRNRGGNRVAGAGVTLQQRGEMLDEAGIELQVICVGAEQPYFPDNQANAVQAARFENDFYKETVEKNGGRYAAFGCVPLPHVDAALAEVTRCLDELGFAGINLACSVAGQPLDTPAFEPFWQEMDRRRAVVFLHPNMHCDAPMMGDWGLEGTAGGCFEDTIAGLRLTFSGWGDKFRNVQLIIPHLGGTLPFLWQRIEDSAGRRRKAGMDIPLQGSPLDVLKRFYYDTVNNGAAALECTIRAVGVDHVLFGTDYPYLTHKECVDSVLNSGLPEAQIRAILDENAEKLLKIPARA